VHTVEPTGRRAAAGHGSGTLTVRVLPRRATAGRSRATARIALRRVAAGRGGRLDVTGDGRVDPADITGAALAWTRAREQGRPGPSLARLQRIAAAARRRPVRAGSAAALTFTVDSLGDAADATRDGACRTSGGVCTLRAAIQEANAHAGPDAIAFAIGGTGVRTIKLTSALPALSDTTGPTTIDGYTQPGSAPNTASGSSNAQIRIEVAGTGYTDSGLDGLGITSAGNVVSGIAFHNLRRALHLYGSGATGNLVTGCFIGTNAAGTAGATTYNTIGTGVVVEQGAAGNRIGDRSAAGRNVISGNARHGVSLSYEATDRNLVFNNVIGLSPGGDRRLPNLKHGVDVNEGASDNQVGGTFGYQRNVISGNGVDALDDYTAGVEVSHGTGTTGNQVVGNYIGTTVSGTTGPAHAHNSHYGVRIEDGVARTAIAGNVIGNNLRGGIKVDAPTTTANRISDNRIGVGTTGTAIPNGEFGVVVAWMATRTTIGPGNVIANNPVGVEIGHPDSDGNTITRNSMYANRGLGIDLEPWTHVNPNDAADGDTGTNQQLNWPVLKTVRTTSVAGTACAGCTVELFLADGAAGAYGEGRTFLTSATAGSAGAFTGTVSLERGQVVTATATDAAGNTSEFSLNVAAT
jgi:CSLREA domain-containing protein